MNQAWDNIKTHIPDDIRSQVSIGNKEGRASKRMQLQCGTMDICHRLAGHLKSLKEQEHPALLWEDYREGEGFHQLLYGFPDTPAEKHIGWVYNSVFTEVRAKLATTDPWKSATKPSLRTEKTMGRLIFQSAEDYRVVFFVDSDGLLQHDVGTMRYFGIDAVQVQAWTNLACSRLSRSRS